MRRKDDRALTASELYREFGAAPPERKMGFLRTVRQVLFFPDHFFQQVERIPVPQAFGHLLKIALFPGLWMLVAQFAFGGGFAASAKAGASTYLGVIISAIFSAGIVHLAVKLAGGKKNVGETFKVASFAGTPWFVLSPSLIPSIFGLIWAVYLQTIGLAASQRIGKLPAFFATILPILVWIGIVAYVVITYPEKVLEILGGA
ncbi:MAG: Yip1 family protein [archaeon]